MYQIFIVTTIMTIFSEMAILKMLGPDNYSLKIRHKQISRMHI